MLVWFIPYIAIPYRPGGMLSVYRDEALTIVLVPLLRRLPPWSCVLARSGGAALLLRHTAAER